MMKENNDHRSNYAWQEARELGKASLDQHSDEDDYREQVVSRRMFGDFRDVLHAASDHLEDLQRAGQNVALFQSLVLMLPDPNNSALWENPAVLDIVRNHLCEGSEDGSYRYAMIPIVAAGVAVQYAKTRKEFDAVAGLYAKGYRSKIRDDLFYWNHFNTNRQGLTKYKLSLRWLWHVLSQRRSDHCLQQPSRCGTESENIQ